MFITKERLAFIILLALATFDNGQANYNVYNITSGTQEETNCTLSADVDYRVYKIEFHPSNIGIEHKTGKLFDIKFRKRSRSQSFHFLCSAAKGFSASLNRTPFTSIDKGCSNGQTIDNNVEYWINVSSVVIKFKDKSYGNCNLSEQINNNNSTALTLCLQAIEPSKDLKVEVVLLPVLFGELFIIIVFLVAWRLKVKRQCFCQAKETDFFTLNSHENIAEFSAGIFPSQPLSDRSSQISDHTSLSSAEAEEPKSNEKSVVPVDIPKIPMIENTAHVSHENVQKAKPPKTLPKPKFRYRLNQMLASKPNVEVTSPPAEKVSEISMVSKSANEHQIPCFLRELEQKQKYILRTKIKDNLERDSRIVSTEIEHIEVLNKTCKRSTYMDMSGMQKLKRNPQKDEDESDYQNMTAFRRLGQLIGRSEAKNEHMCSRLIGKEEPHFYEIGSAQCESILGNLKDRNPNRTVIWNMRTNEKEFTYVTRIDSTEEVNCRKKFKKANVSKQNTLLSAQHISVFFDDRSNTDSVGTGSDFDRLSYISALDGIYRSSAIKNNPNAHFAYLFDGSKDSRLSDTQFSDVAKKDNQEKFERRLSSSSSDSGLSDEETNNDECLVCQYNEKVVYVNISEIKKPEPPPKLGGFRGMIKRGSVKSKDMKSEEIRVRVVSNETERKRSTFYFE